MVCVSARTMTIIMQVIFHIVTKQPTVYIEHSTAAAFSSLFVYEID